MNCSMIVECNKCHTKLRMDPTKISPTGTRVRCTKCQTVFTVMPPEAVLPKPMPAYEPTDPSFVSHTNLMEEVLEPEPPPPPPPPPLPEKKPSIPPKRPQPPKIVSAPPKLPSPAPSRVMVDPDLPFGQKWQRTSILVGVMVAGFLLGLAAMGIKPTPSSLRLLLHYGARPVSSGLQIVSYEERVVTGESGQKKLGVWGKIYNASSEKIHPKNIRLQVLNPMGEFLVKKVDRCCQEDLKPEDFTPFYIEVDLPSQNFGAYDLSLEN